MILDLISEAVTHLMSHLIFRRRQTVDDRVEQRRREQARRPSAAHVERIKAAYVSWAATRDLELIDEVRGYRGLLVGRPARVRPGLDGGTPSCVEVEIAIEHESEPTLLEGDAESHGAVADALHQLFDEEGLATLRSIAINREGVRLRFSPLAPPLQVEAGAERVVEELARLERERRAHDHGRGPFR